MREGDDSNDTDFEAHRHASRSAMSAERRAFLKSGFAATSGAAALATAGISVVPPNLERFQPDWNKTRPRPSLIVSCYPWISTPEGWLGVSSQDENALTQSPAAR